MDDMSIFIRQRRLNYTRQQLFKLVAEVEEYPRFLPMWQQARVTSREESDDTTDGACVYHTDQVIRMGPMPRRFRTVTALHPYEHIKVTSDDPLFRCFMIDWRFKPEGESACLLRYEMDCMAASPLLHPVFDLALQSSSNEIIDQFEQRARQLYGH